MADAAQKVGDRKELLQGAPQLFYGRQGTTVPTPIIAAIVSPEGDPPAEANGTWTLLGVVRRLCKHGNWVARRSPCVAQCNRRQSVKTSAAPGDGAAVRQATFRPARIKLFCLFSMPEAIVEILQERKQ